jgi:NAD(P)H-flavin reductase
VKTRKNGNRTINGHQNIGGFLCRGGLPECQWMNNSGLFLFIYLFVERAYDFSVSNRKPRDVLGNGLSNQQIRTCYNRLRIELGSEAVPFFQSVVPGQFVMLDLTQTALPAQEKIPNDLKDAVKRQLILRRPFSFSDVSVSQGENGPVVKLEIMYCVLGPSTVRMTSLSKGDKINVLGPLGKGFNILPDKELSILIAGGMGAPPLLHLASVLKKLPTRICVFAGAKSCDDLPFTMSIG